MVTSSARSQALTTPFLKSNAPVKPGLRGKPGFTGFLILFPVCCLFDRTLFTGTNA